MYLIVFNCQAGRTGCLGAPLMQTSLVRGDPGATSTATKALGMEPPGQEGP